MSSESQKGNRSYNLFSIFIDSSHASKDLHNLPFYTVDVGQNVTISFKGNVIYTITESTEKLKISWFGNLIELFYQLKGMKIRVLCFNNIIKIYSKLPVRPFIKESDYIKTINASIFDSENALYFSFNSGLDKDAIIKISNEVEAEAENWIKNAPLVPNSVVNSDLWNYVWALHKLFCSGMLPLQSSCAWAYELESKYCSFIFRDLVSILDDLMWYRPDLVGIVLKNLKEKYINEDGFCESVGFTEQSVSSKPIVSQPPVFSYFILEFYKYTKDFEIINDWYPLFKRNIEWWENHRLNTELGLFVLQGKIEDICAELGLGPSERFYFDYSSEEIKPFDNNTIRKVIPVDLNSQMADLYQNVGVMANLMEDDEYTTHCFQQADLLQNRVKEFLWDEDSKFFYDYDLETKSFIKIKTSAAFWTLFGGTATKTQSKFLHDAIRDPKQFWTEFPIGSLPMDSPLISKGISVSKTSLANNIWIIIGLKRNNFQSTVAEIAQKCLRYMGRTFEIDQKVYEYYPSNSYNRNIFGKTMFDRMPRENKLEAIPIHSLVYRAILGAEILDEGISFVPDWLTIDSTIKFSIFYSNKKQDCYLDKFERKMLTLF